MSTSSSFQPNRLSVIVEEGRKDRVDADLVGHTVYSNRYASTVQQASSSLDPNAEVLGVSPRDISETNHDAYLSDRTAPQSSTAWDQQIPMARSTWGSYGTALYADGTGDTSPGMSCNSPDARPKRIRGKAMWRGARGDMRDTSVSSDPDGSQMEQHLETRGASNPRFARSDKTAAEKGRVGWVGRKIGRKSELGPRRSEIRGPGPEQRNTVCTWLTSKLGALTSRLTPRSTRSWTRSTYREDLTYVEEHYGDMRIHLGLDPDPRSRHGLRVLRYPGYQYQGENVSVYETLRSMGSPDSLISDDLITRLLPWKRKALAKQKQQVDILSSWYHAQSQGNGD